MELTQADLHSPTILAKAPRAELPDSGEPKAMPPVAGEPKPVLPDAGKPRAMPPFAGATEAVLSEFREPKAMQPVAGENEVVLPDSREPKAMSPIAGGTQAMLPVVKPKPPPGGLTLSCKTLPQPAMAPPQSSNVEKLKRFFQQDKKIPHRFFCL